MIRSVPLSASEIGHSAEECNVPGHPSHQARGSNSWLAWQLADSALPVGGFAHSSGLEAAWQLREVTNAQELTCFIHDGLVQSQNAALPFVKAAHQDSERLIPLDELFEAFTPNHVANRASRLQGKSLAAAALRIFSRELDGTQVQSARPPVWRGHLAPLFGGLYSALGIDLTTTLRLFLFIQTRGIISAAVRLNMIGPIEGQAIQWRLTPIAESIATGNIPAIDEIAQTAPLLDLWQGVQDRLYSRLFQS